MATARPDDPRLPYLQIMEDLRSAIAEGRIAPGEKIPTNAELKRKYGVASQTAQNAVNALKADGLIYGIAGRGVFVRSDVDVEALRLAATPGDAASEESIGAVLAQLTELTQKVEYLQGRLEELESKVELRGSAGTEAAN